MLRAPREVFASAVGKAERAYGSSVIGCLASVIEFLETNPDKLVRAITALKMSVPYDDLWPLIVSLRLS